uniref:HDC05276 n=1 Tax=Drosophila melanogaster TaxID=7227 RepID=Q6IGT7_DROME|nr:TPA_inf: HDC05276 [Drosophila melanogaster]
MHTGATNGGPRVSFNRDVHVKRIGQCMVEEMGTSPAERCSQPAARVSLCTSSLSEGVSGEDEVDGVADADEDGPTASGRFVSAASNGPPNLELPLAAIGNWQLATGNWRVAFPYGPDAHPCLIKRKSFCFATWRYSYSQSYTKPWLLTAA